MSPVKAASQRRDQSRGTVLTRHLTLSPIAIRLLVLLLVGVSTAAAQASHRGETGAPVGCYTLEHAAWPSSLDHRPNPAQIPGGLELTADPYLIRITGSAGSIEEVEAPGLDGARIVRYPQIQEGGGPFSFWQVSRDELRLGRYMPLGGFYVRATRAGDDWEGELVGFTDMIPADGHASESVAARLVRVPCDQQ